MGKEWDDNEDEDTRAARESARQKDAGERENKAPREGDDD